MRDGEIIGEGTIFEVRRRPNSPDVQKYPKDRLIPIKAVFERIESTRSRILEFFKNFPGVNIFVPQCTLDLDDNEPCLTAPFVPDFIPVGELSDQSIENLGLDVWLSFLVLLNFNKGDGMFSLEHLDIYGKGDFVCEAAANLDLPPCIQEKLNQFERARRTLDPRHGTNFGVCSGGEKACMLDADLHYKPERPFLKRAEALLMRPVKTLNTREFEELLWGYILSPDQLKKIIRGEEGVEGKETAVARLLMMNKDCRGKLDQMIQFVLGEAKCFGIVEVANELLKISESPFNTCDFDLNRTIFAVKNYIDGIVDSDETVCKSTGFEFLWKVLQIIVDRSPKNSPVLTQSELDGIKDQITKSISSGKQHIAHSALGEMYWDSRYTRLFLKSGDLSDRLTRYMKEDFLDKLRGYLKSVIDHPERWSDVSLNCPDRNFWGELSLSQPGFDTPAKFGGFDTNSFAC